MLTSAEIHIDDGTRAQQNKTVIIISLYLCDGAVND